MEEKLHSIKETLHRLSISRTNLYTLIKQGKITPVKLGKRTLFTEEEINRFIGALKK